MDSVAFGWSHINEKGEFTLEGGEYFWPEAAGDITPESLVSGAAAEGVKPYLMVYSLDGDNQLTLMLSDETLRNRSIDSIAALVKDKGFGGVMLDFEGLGLKLDAASQQKLLNDYVRQLVDKISPLGATVSVAVPPPNSAYKGYDYITLASMAEDLMIMAYKYHPKGVTGPEPNSMVDDAITMLVKAGVPKNKLLLGISLGSETPDSIDDKIGLAKRHGLKGAAIWLLKIYSPAHEEAVNRVVEKIGK
ncbi:glycosyl hydrolase family 18 protein [Cohnella kolymensis]|uniref:glycosyl hydrolase family 18 protein n=1 Tax=Cohnella kolymensis TaxID=1590652 RepID=UPI00126A2C44|nr:glycosyl hydrolase family 18 protein [Cohnella kolymensis]